MKINPRCGHRSADYGSLVNLALMLVLVVLLTSCGVAGNSQPPPPPTQLQINLPTVLIDETTQVQFTANVNGLNYPNVTWSVKEGAAGGSISTVGVYTPPHRAGTYHVVATDLNNPKQRATSVVTVVPIVIAIDPTVNLILPSTTVQFRAEWSGIGGYGIVWSVQEGAAGGSITSGGLYTTPATTGTFHVVASSAFDSTQFATAAVTVVNSGTFFHPTGDLSYARVGHTATVVSNGVLIVGGGYCVEDPGNGCFLVPIAPAELFDETAAAFSLTGSLLTRRESHTANLLPNGRVLVAGGYDGTDATSTSELYDPLNGQFTQTGNMITARFQQTATLLNTGKVLLVGGLSRYPGTPLAAAELYNFAHGQFTATGSLRQAQYGHTATLLPNGRVLLAGGFVADAQGGISPTNSAELYDPATDTFTATGNMGTPRGYHAAVLLGNGKVLIAGGYAGNGPVTAQTPPTAELYDPSTGSFTYTGNMAIGREGLTATLLVNGEVLVAGGQNGFLGDLSVAELYDPVSQTFAPAGSLGTPRSFHTATLLPDGKVLVTGGSSQTAEIY